MMLNNTQQQGSSSSGGGVSSSNNMAHSLITGNMDELDKMKLNEIESHDDGVEVGVEQQLRGPAGIGAEAEGKVEDKGAQNDAAAVENGDNGDGTPPRPTVSFSNSVRSLEDLVKDIASAEFTEEEAAAAAKAEDAAGEDDDDEKPKENCWNHFLDSMMQHVPTKSRKEGAFVFISGSLLAFNAGFANGATMSELLHYSGANALVSGYAGSYTKSAIHASKGNVEEFGFYTCLILAYMFGNFIVGLIIPKPVPYRLCAVYGPTFLIGGVFELAAAILAAIEIEEPNYIFYFACAAAGIQNGIASSYSANLIRCAATGGSTDFALYLGNVLRGNKRVLWRLVILTSILINFWLGGYAAYEAVKKLGPNTLFVNVGLFWSIGIGLVYFLVHELGVTIQAATIGTWKWDQTVSALSERLAADNIDMMDLFDEIDVDASGEITPDELFEFLLQHEVKISPKEVRLLMKFADENGDGVIDRDEWVVIIKKLKARQALPAHLKLST